MNFSASVENKEKPLSKGAIKIVVETSSTKTISSI